MRTAALVRGLLASTAADPQPERWDEALAEAERRAPVARECLVRARAVLEGWWALRDPVTGLLPRRTDDPRWAPQDNAADLFPFLVLAAGFTAPDYQDGLSEVFRREVELTTRLDGLPDWYSIPERRFLHAQPDIARLVFGATEYAKDGLNPLIELLGPEPWSGRMLQLVDGVLTHASVASDFGPLPAGDTEVNGELLQVLTRLHFLTGERRHLEAAERIGDAYCLEVLPSSGGLPTHRWDFTRHQAVNDVLSLNDHGNEIVGGLAELYAAVRVADPQAAARYEQPLRRMFDTLLERARNSDGLWHARVRPSTGEVLEESVPDTWGYALAATLSFGLATGEGRYVDAVRQALASIDQDRYLSWNGADSYADSIEGALLLLARLPEPAGFAWLERVLPRFFAQQRLPADGGTGIVEGWYGDGNYARTALMVALCYSGGTRIEPWRPEVTLGAAVEGDALCLSLVADTAWSGRLRFDSPRHREHFGLPHDLPRLNQFPEWYALEPAQLYRVRTVGGDGTDAAAPQVRLGAELITGLPLDLAPRERLRLVVEPLGPPPYGAERGPVDPFAALDARGGDPALLEATDLDGGESYAGETYAWSKAAPIEWRATGPGGPVDATLWLRWGAKGDVRRGRLQVGSRTIDLEHGGYDGFDWLAVDVPRSWWGGDTLEVRLEPPRGGPAAFVSSLRLRRVVPTPVDDAFDLQLEAEDLEGAWRLQRNLPGFSGQGFRVSNAEGVAASSLWTELDLPAGPLNVWVRGHEGDDQDRRFALSLGDMRLEPTHRGRGRRGFCWQLAGCMEARGGPLVLEVRDAGVGFEVVDAIRVTSDLAFDPGVEERVRTALLRGDDIAPVARLVEACSASAEAAHERIGAQQVDAGSWEAERLRLGARLRASLGLDPLPARTPLNARVHGILQRDGYRVERTSFESRPGFVVTASVYVPGGMAAGERRPAVLCPVGHWGLGKAEPVVQARCIGLAKQGYVVLTYDPFGQGERAVAGNDHGEYARSILVGADNMTFMVWDTLRALDLLLERTDVDPERVACTGASGGGLNTLYAAAIDERIRVAVPTVYVTRLRELLETRHAHCPCSHVNGLAAFMDMGDVAALIAPRPLLLLTAERDASFTPAGAQAAVDQARGAYALFGEADDLDVRVFDTGHGYDRPMREALYGWLAHHLQGAPTAAPVPEPELAPEAALDLLRCFPEGRLPEGTLSVRDQTAERAATLTRSGPRSPAWIHDALGEQLGLVTPAAAQPVELDAGLLGLLRESSSSQMPTPIAFVTREGTRVSGWRRAAAGAGRPLVVVWGDEVPDEGSSLVRAAAASGAELMGLGLAPGTGPDLHVLATDAHLLGEPLLVQRALAIAAVMRALRRYDDVERPVLCAADGPRASLALLLAQVACGGADALALQGLPDSLLEAFEGPLPPLDLYAWRLLEIADVPDLIPAAGVPVLCCEPGSSFEGLGGLLERIPGR
jgi:dienelactone hydrolase